MNEIRKLGLEELDPFVLLMANAYPGIGLSTQEAQNRLRERWMQAVRDDAPTAFYGYFRDGRMIGGMRWYKYMINVHGVRLQAAGIGSVGYVEIGVDKATGRLIDYEAEFEREDEPDQTVNPEEAVASAAEVLEQFIPASKKQIQLTYLHNPFAKRDLPDWLKEDRNEEDFSGQYSMVFRDLYDGIPVNFSSYAVDIDPATGMVLELSLRDVDILDGLPEAEDIVSADQAESALLAYRPLRLAYIWPRYEDRKAAAPVLVYEPESKPYAYIDAFTGRVVELEEQEDEE